MTIIEIPYNSLTILKIEDRKPTMSTHISGVVHVYSVNLFSHLSASHDCRL
jgi:hypothetical protein